MRDGQETGLSEGRRQQAANRFESVVRSLFLIHGYGDPGADRVGRVVHAGMAGASDAELRSPDGISAATIGRFNQLVVGAMEAGRPYNIHSAEAARLAQSGERGGDGLPGFKAFAEAQRMKAEARAEQRVRGEASGRSGERYAALPAAGDGLAPGVMSAYVQQYAGLGLERGTVRGFAAVGLDRPLYDSFRREGFTTAQIADNAKDAKVLGWHGKDDLTISQHAPTDLRKAAVAETRATTPEARAERHKNTTSLAEKYEALPDGDRRKHDARRFIERFNRDGYGVESRHDVGSRMRQRDAEIVKPGTGPHDVEVSATQDKAAAKFVKQAKVSAISNAADAFGGEAQPAPNKPAAAKVAIAKSPAAGPQPA